MVDDIKKQQATKNKKTKALRTLGKIKFQQKENSNSQQDSSPYLVKERQRKKWNEAAEPEKKT